jgi:serine/threonine protein kinase
LFNLLTGRYLFGGNSRNEVLRHNERCDLSSKKKYVVQVSENGQSLLFQMLTHEPTQRPTAREALEHPWFSDERVLLNNLIHLNDFLSNAKGLNRGSLMNASVSSFNMQNIIDMQNPNVPNNKNYESFKVASNFFLRLRKEDVDLRNSGLKAINP